LIATRQFFHLVHGSIEATRNTKKDSPYRISYLLTTPNGGNGYGGTGYNYYNSNSWGSQYNNAGNGYGGPGGRG
jgi:hypothetical protein